MSLDAAIHVMDTNYSECIQEETQKVSSVFQSYDGSDDGLFSKIQDEKDTFNTSTNGYGDSKAC